MSSFDDQTDPFSDGDLTDMLGELRVLLPGSQLLSGFLIAVPFAPGFARMVGSEHYIFLATFLFALISLVFLSAPAIQHRMVRPLRDRERFKAIASRQILLGAATLGISLVLATQLVLSTVMGQTVGNVAAGFLAGLILLIWCWVPWLLRDRGHF
jgi:peptidoglycan biosynthesis protein MviN/MurJ (putative lipid II flippase)